MPNYMQEWDGSYPEEIHVDIPTASELPRLKAAAYSGSSPAALSVMLFYVNDDDGEFMQCYWASIAAQNGSRDGIFNLATCYETTSYAFYSPIRAKFWYQKGVSLGDAGSRKRIQHLQHIRMNNDAIDAGGKSVILNLSEYENSAYSGSAMAAMLLAEHYKGEEKACYWYSIAVENGGGEARSSLSKCHADKSSWMFSPHRKKFWLR